MTRTEMLEKMHIAAAQSQVQRCREIALEYGESEVTKGAEGVLDRLEDAGRKALTIGLVSPSEQLESIIDQMYAVAQEIVSIKNEIAKQKGE